MSVLTKLLNCEKMFKYVLPKVVTVKGNYCFLFGVKMVMGDYYYLSYKLKFK